MSKIQTTLDYADAIADWFLEIGEAYCRNSRLEEAFKCANTAASILANQNRTLSSERLK